MQSAGCSYCKSWYVIEWGVKKFVEFNDFLGNRWYNYEQDRNIYQKSFC